LQKYNARYVPSTTAKVVPLSCSTFGSMAKKGIDFLESLAKRIAHTRCAQTVDKLRGGPKAVRMEYSKQLRNLSEIICLGILRRNASMLSQLCLALMPTTSSACKHASEAKLQQHLLSSNVLL
jgi:hypothetical protein